MVGKTLGYLGYLLLLGTCIGGLIQAVVGFFNYQVCSGADCHWLFAEWPQWAWILLFIFIYLPLTPILSFLFGMFFYFPVGIAGCILIWVGAKISR